MSEAGAAFGPGRVNLIGEHTDYNGGLCLAFAIREGVTVRARRRDDEIVARAWDLDEEDRFPVPVGAAAGTGEAADKFPLGVGGVSGWRAFVRGCVVELHRAGRPPPGCELDISSSLAQGAGLSSSAALEVALCLAILAMQDVRDAVAPTDLARLCSRVENVWVGAETGLLDQMASLHGREGMGMLIDMRALAVSYVPIRLNDWTLATLGSGHRHDLAASRYNDRRAECRDACERLGVDFLSDASREAAARLPDPLDRRTAHVIEENARVARTAEALRADDWPAVGRLLDESHASLRDLYEVSVAEVERTVERAQVAGAAGCRIVGGGFGGSVLGLFPPGVPPPADALVVEPGAGGRLIG